MIEYTSGPINIENLDSTGIRIAGEGAFRYALRNAGWSEEKIDNSLRTHFYSVVKEIQEKLIANMGPEDIAFESDYVKRFVQGYYAAVHYMNSPE